MIVINLYGAPGAGKSTGAAYVYSKLKMMGYNVELVTEFAKDCVWEDSYKTLDDQIYIFGKQYHQLKRLEGKVDIVITDSPILLGVIYNKDKTIAAELKNLIKAADNKFETYNVLIKRIKPYQAAGRVQNENESDEIEQEINKLIEKETNKEFMLGEFEGAYSGYTRLLYKVLKIIERNAAKK